MKKRIDIRLNQDDLDFVTALAKEENTDIHYELKKMVYDELERMKDLYWNSDTKELCM